MENRQPSNPMCRQAWSIPALIREQYAPLEHMARTLMTTPEIFSIQRIILTGCGDSYAAALSMKHIFELLTQIPTEVVEPLDLARYYHPKQIGFAPNNPLVFAVSNSGSVSRVDEAVQFVNEHGGFTLGITSRPDSPLGVHAKRVFQTAIDSFEPSPGVRSYLVSVLSLLLLAIRIGEVRGRQTMDQSEQLRRDILRQADVLEQLLPQMDEQTRALALRWREMPAFDFIGGGFDYAAAFYGHAKILEATGRHSSCVDAEEWLHLNFFARGVATTATVIVANTTNPAISRVSETIRYARQLGRPLLILTDGKLEAAEDHEPVIRVPKTQTQITMPLTQFVPLALLAGYLSEALGEEYGRGCKGPWQFADGAACIRNSRVVVRKTLLQQES